MSETRESVCLEILEEEYLLLRKMRFLPMLPVHADEAPGMVAAFSR